MKIASLALATLIVAAGSVTASAHSSVRPIDKRLDLQAEKIEQGRRTGSITWTEGRKLRKEQREIARARDAFVADGHLSKREARVLKHKQDAARWNIIAEKHDARRRLWWLPRVGK